jgi:hypothetical protein
MSIIELKQNQRAIQSLKEEISNLRGQQIAAQNLAALAGMTIDRLTSQSSTRNGITKFRV